MVCLCYLGVLCVLCILCIFLSCIYLPGLPAFIAAFGHFWYTIAGLLCTSAFPVQAPVQYLLLHALALKFVLPVFLLAPVSELGMFLCPCLCLIISLLNSASLLMPVPELLLFELLLEPAIVRELL